MKKLIPKFIFNIYHYLLAFIGAVIYGFPSKKLIVIGVTGTKGKTTVVHLLSEVLQQSDLDTASISSIRFKIKDKEEKNMLKMTMPGRFKLQKFIRQAVNQKCKYLILEVTSEGIKQHRHRFIDFNGIVFTNLEKEHIESHGSFENYKKAKGKLFKALEKSKKKNKFVVLNADDEHSEYFSKLAGNVKKVFYDKNTKAETSLPGEFNKYNAAAVLKTAETLGLTLGKTLGILKTIKGLPGRMETVIEKPFKVIVDYAHTPDSLEKVYKTIQDTRYKIQDTNLICVFGSCGGGRDKWKRPEMGKIAADYCNHIILTNEDPYDEEPSQILSDIKSGIQDTKYKIPDTVYEILDRRKAINKALSIAQDNDIVIITGKGSEPWMCVEKGRKIAWDDREVVKEEYNKIYG